MRRRDGLVAVPGWRARWIESRRGCWSAPGAAISCPQSLPPRRGGECVLAGVPQVVEVQAGQAHGGAGAAFQGRPEVWTGAG